MAGITVRKVETEAEWENFLATRPEVNFLHSWLWGDFHECIGHQVFRRGFYEDDKLVGVVLMIVEPARRGRHLVVPGGPIIDWHRRAIVQAWVDDSKKIAKEAKCVFVRVRPQLLKSPNSEHLFKGLKFRRAPMHLHAELTSQLDLTKSDEELKKAMRKGARYDLNRAHKFGIEVEATQSEDFLDEFYDLQIQTAKRQNFVPFSKKFLSEQFKVFSGAGHATMYRSTYEGKLLSMAFVIFYGQEAAYHYGASTQLAREYPGAYAIQWQAIQDARRRGCSRYNFWGVTEHGQTKHRFYGVSVFKRGFGGEDVAYLPAHDLVINRAKYVLTYSFETARRKLRKL